MVKELYKKNIEELIHYSKKLYYSGYQMGNGGNISVRIPNKNLMLVKGTNVAFDEIGEGKIVLTDLDGNLVEGNIKPSKEVLLHGAIYQKKQEINAIVHCHACYSTAWASHDDELKFSTHHAKMKLGGNCPVFDTHSYVVDKNNIAIIISFLEKNPNVNSFLLRAHGIVTMGGDLREAAYLAELVEETAKISILSRI